MYSVGFVFPTEEEMMKVANKLWTKHNVSGEMEMFQVDDQRFRLNIHSEKQIRESILDNIPGKRTQAKSNYGASAPKESIDESDD